MKHRHKIFVTRKIPEEALDLLKKECQVEISPYQRPIKKEELLEKVADQDGLLVLVTDSIDREIIEAGKKLKIISGWGEGYNHIDVAAATEKNILVTNTPTDHIATAVAEHTLGLVLTLAKNIIQGNNIVKAGLYQGWRPEEQSVDLINAVYGIIGLGRIGIKVAQRLRGWGMRLIYSDLQKADADAEKILAIRQVHLEVLLRESDFISIHIPLTKETYHMIGYREICLMKPTAYIINVSRGGIINEKDLVRALLEKRIAGAALDVWETEPKISPDLIGLNNLILTPHSAGATKRGLIPSAVMAAENLLAGLRDEIPENLVNPV